MSDKEPKIIHLGNNTYRFVGEIQEHHGKVKYDFKFEVIQTGSLSAAVESVVNQIIRRELKLRASDHIKKLSDDTKQ